MDLNGIYRGYSPTDESGIGVGELEVIINDDFVCFRFATGLEIVSNEVSSSQLREMAPSEVAARFSSPIGATGVTGYMLGDDGMIILFFPETDCPEQCRVVVQRFVSDEIDAIFDFTYLFTPDQVAAGYFDKSVIELEGAQRDPRVIPRLANNGRRG